MKFAAGRNACCRLSYALRLPLCCVRCASPRPAQDYPSRPITIIVPLAAGTGMDIIARLYGERLSQSLGKPVVVENKPGAGMIPATQAALAAPPDGHTLLVATPLHALLNQTLFKQLPYDPEKDLVPVSHYLTSPFILVLNPALPLQYGPRVHQIRQGAAGAAELQLAGRRRRRAFRGRGDEAPLRPQSHPRSLPNSPQSIMDIASGHVHFAFAEAGASLALIRDGKLRALAVSSKQRLPAIRRSRRSQKQRMLPITRSWRGTCWWRAPVRRSRLSSG